MHTIYICTIKNKEIIDHIYAAIVGMGVNVSAADSNGSMYATKEGARTTIVGITVHNFNSKLTNSDLLNRVAKAISKYQYFGLVLKNNNGSSSWQAGNVGVNALDNILAQPSQDDQEKEEKKEESKLAKADKAIDEMLKSKDPEPEPTPPTPPSQRKDSPSSPKIDLHKLKNIVKSTIGMSDVFISEPNEDRKLILRELELLCENQTQL